MHVGNSYIAPFMPHSADNSRVGSVHPFRSKARRLLPGHSYLPELGDQAPLPTPLTLGPSPAYQYRCELDADPIGCAVSGGDGNDSRVLDCH